MTLRVTTNDEHGRGRLTSFQGLAAILISKETHMTRATLLSNDSRRSLLTAITAVGKVLGLLALAVALFAPIAQADGRGDPKVIDPDSVAYGRTFGEWSAAWEQWADSIPVAEHPLFDNPSGHPDCSVGQSGPVWFLGGKFCASGASCSYTGVVRSCTIPAGKALYFPVLNYEDSALEESLAENPGVETDQQIATLRAIVGGGEDAVTNVSCSVDGEPIRDLRANYRVQSTAFGFTLPTDNLFKTIYGNNGFVAGSYFPAVDDGWYVMLAPLRPGPHVVHISGTAPGPFTLDVTYYLQVQH